MLILTNPIVQLAAAGVTALALSLWFTPLVRAIALKRGWVAVPAEDRWGKRVTARLGGIGLFFSFLITVFLFVPMTGQMVTLLGCSALIAAIGLWDDFNRMRPYTKLTLQIAVGSLMVLGGIRIELIPWPALAIPLTIFWFVMVINAFNLLDNMDGLAAGIAALAAGFCALHAALHGQWAVSVVAVALIGICLGFLKSNFPPANIYMGDSGSHLLGLNLGALALMGSWQHSSYLISVLAVPVLVLAVPIFDMCFVTVLRLINGRHPFSGGTDHLSHRLAILGLSQRQTVLILYALSFVLGSVSLLSMRITSWTTATMGMGILAVLLLLAGYLAKVRVYELQLQPHESNAAVLNKPMTRIETMLFHKRRILEVIVDFAVICMAYIAAHLLRFEGQLPHKQMTLMVQSLPVIICVQLLCFSATRLYHGVWRYVSVPDVLTIAKGVIIGTAAGILSVVYLWRFEEFSRSVFIIYALLLMLGISGARIGERLFNEWLARMIRGNPSLIIGAGDTGEFMLRSLKLNHKQKHWVVGFLDDDNSKHGLRIHGVQVLGATSRLERLIYKHKIREVYIAIQSPPEHLVSCVRGVCADHNVRVRVVPQLELQTL